VVVRKRRHEKPDLHCFAKFEFCAVNLNLTLRMDGKRKNRKNVLTFLHFKKPKAKQLTVSNAFPAQDFI
jgi:hypothetical protein